MAEPLFPLLLEPADLAAQLTRPDIAVVDLSQAAIHARAHLPGAVHLEYARVTAPRPPAAAVLPEATQLADVLGSIGLTPDKHVVAYDEEGNGKAARFLWTLHMIGHTRASILNGGLRAWMAEQRPVEAGVKPATRTNYPAKIAGEAMVDKNYLLAHLKDPQVVILDARTPDEYAGRVKRSTRGGHIPGAVNFNWTDAVDPARHLKLKDLGEIKAALEKLGVTPDKEVVTYCQTHHRSAHTYFVLKTLGFDRVKAYPGSWSEWGNLPDTPIE